MTVDARTLKWFRDLLPADALLKEEMLTKLKNVFKTYAFSPIETPHLELKEVLLSQVGEDTQKEVYSFEDHGKRQVALRFDQTVPLARYVISNREQIKLPFKRYAIWNVFRGENPQSGRYREFTQCDFDFVGTTSIVSDFEVIEVMASSMLALGIENFTISFNNRKVLNGLLDSMGIEDKVDDVLRIIDKLAKIGDEKVKTLLVEKEITSEQADKILSFVKINTKDLDASFFDKIAEFANWNEKMEAALNELKVFSSFINASELTRGKCLLDFSIARGLAYYTGIVYETTLDDCPEMGSVCSGGRYDDLTKTFSKDDISGVGAAIWIDRLIAALEKLGKLEKKASPAKVLITNMWEEYVSTILNVASELRKENINVEVYPDSVKMGKQFKFADAKGYNFVVVIGETEKENGTVSLKNMKEGTQDEISIKELILKLK